MYEDELLRITHMLESIIDDLDKTIKYVYSLQILIDATEDRADEPKKSTLSLTLTMTSCN